MAKKEGKTLYLDIMKVKEWEEWCDTTGRVLSRMIPIAVDAFIKNNK